MKKRLGTRGAAARPREQGRTSARRRRRTRIGGRRVSKSRQTPTSILLSMELIKRLRAKAAKRGIGYQTMMKIIVHEHVDDY